MGSLATQVALLAENRERFLRYAFILQFIASIPFLWFATTTGKQHAHLLLKGTNTTGIIVSVIPVQFFGGSNSSSSSTTSYQAVVSFSAQGDQFRFQEWKGTRIAPSLGARVRVIYDPSNPEIAMVDRGFLNFLPWAPCAVIGGLLFLAAVKGFVALFFHK